MIKPPKPVVYIIMLTAGLLSMQKSYAQRLFFIFGHALYNSPVQSDLKNNYNYGLGAEAGAGIGANKTFLTATVGYGIFNSKNGNAAGNLTYVPAKLGIRQYIVGKLVFLNANAGLVNLKPNKGDSQSRFTADAGVGIKVAGIDLGINYDGYAGKDPSGWASWVSFKAGFNIGL